MAATLRNPRYVRSALASNAFAARSRYLRHSTNLLAGGHYRITGTVTELGVAGRYRVRLFHRLTAACLGETWSAADGSYSFSALSHIPSGYFVIAFDHGDNPLNAAIADLVTPEPMP